MHFSFPILPRFKQLFSLTTEYTYLQIFDEDQNHQIKHFIYYWNWKWICNGFYVVVVDTEYSVKYGGIPRTSKTFFDWWFINLNTHECSSVTFSFKKSVVYSLDIDYRFRFCIVLFHMRVYGLQWMHVSLLFQCCW